MIIFLVILLIIGIFILLSFYVFPAISGYGSKNLCSAVFLQHRNPADVIREDLSKFPISLGTFTINENDSSATGSVLGIAKRKTIYRKGVGCTMVNDFSEAEIRKQEFIIPTPNKLNSESIPWPYGDKLVDTTSLNINRKLLQSTVDNMMKASTLDGTSAHTRATIIIYDGNIIAEEYADGFNKNTVMLGWSVSKSLTAAMIGILVKKEKISVDLPAPVASWKNTKKQKITIKNLLQQTSGLDFVENYARPANVVKMLFSKGDMAAYAESLPLKYEPGTVFNYSSGNSIILSGCIRKIVGEKDYHAFPYKELFHKINAYSFLLEPDASGSFVGSSYSYATARDFARFGLLYYNNGTWNGEQILPKNWVKESVQPSSADKRKQYGYQLRLNGYDEKDTSKRCFPGLPNDLYFAHGYGGQDIYIIPSKKLVVVRLGLYQMKENHFLKDIIQSITN